MRALRRRTLCSVYPSREKSYARRRRLAGRDDDDTEIGNLIFSKVFRRDGGEDVEVELDDLPVDVFNEAYADHPSFRVPDQNRTGRRRR